MTDLPTRLRALANDWTIKHQFNHISELASEAADDIERLREKCDRSIGQTERLVAEKSNWLQERDALKAKLAELERARQQATEGSLSNYKRAERAEADVTELRLRFAEQTLALFKAEAEATGLRDALDGIAKGDFRIESWVTVRDERDEARAEAAALKERMRSEETEKWIDLYTKATAEAAEWKERHGAQADMVRSRDAHIETILAEAVALREGLSKCITEADKWDLSMVGWIAKQALSQPGPGAALLEEHSRLKGIVDSLTCAFEANGVQGVGLQGCLAALLERVKKLEALKEAVKAMRANLFEHEDALGGKHTAWFTVASCEYGEAVDDALAALEEKK